MPTPYPMCLVLDAKDMARSARFWREALGYVVASEGPSYVSLAHPKDPRRLTLGLQPADGPKQGANPVHLDLATDDKEREARRLEALGATRVQGWPYPEDATWIVMRDLDGHEFCLVEQPAGELLHRD